MAKMELAAKMLEFPRIMDVHKLSAYIDGLYTPGTLYRLACQGRIPCHRKPAKLWFLKEEIDAWLHGRAQPKEENSISRFQDARSRLRSLKTEDTHLNPDALSKKGAG